MGEQKRFKKQTVKADADKGMEQGAKILKGGVGLIGSLVLLIANKDNIKTLGKNVANFATKIIKR